MTEAPTCEYCGGLLEGPIIDDPNKFYVTHKPDQCRQHVIGHLERKIDLILDHLDIQHK